MSASQNLAFQGDIQRVLIIKWSALGDVVMATALMEDIRQAFPHARIDLNTLPASAPLFAHDPRFDEVFAIDVRKKGARLRNALAWVRRVRHGHYDLIVDLQRTDHTRALLTLLLLTGARPRALVGNRGGFPYSRTPAVTDPKAHAFLMMRAVLEAVGLPARTNHPVLYAGAAHLEHAAQLLDQHGLKPGRFAVFLPGSQAAGWLKRWGVERFRALGGLIKSRGLAERIAIIGGPDEAKDCQEISAAGDFLVNLNGRTALLEIAPLCSQAAFIVANDTGTAHIAAAANRPMLIICGPTDPSRVRPIGLKVRAIQAELPCSSCYAKDCLIEDKQKCMRVITPEFVAAEIEAMLSGKTNPMSAAVPIRRFIGLP